MAALAESETGSISEAVRIREILRQGMRIYRSDFLSLVAPFLLPSMGRLLWTIAQRLFIHSRHPGWPQAGILVNADWGLSIYWSAMVLTCAGLLVYFILAGPALALTSLVVAAPMSSENSAMSSNFSIRYLGLQLLSALRAWWVFIAGMLGTVIIGATLLDSNPDQGLAVWYALDAVTFLVGLPVGVWLSLRYFLVIPSACREGMRSKAAFSRSSQLTSGIKLRLLAAISALLALRWALGFLACWSLEWIALANPRAVNASTFLLVPFTICLLDCLFGPMWAIAAALLYAKRSISAPPSNGTNP